MAVSVVQRVSIVALTASLPTAAAAAAAAAGAAAAVSATQNNAARHTPAVAVIAYLLQVLLLLS